MNLSCSHHRTQVNLTKTTLPNAPRPVGNYQTFQKAGNLIFINQIALKEGKIVKSGRIEKEVSFEEARVATRQTTLNILAVLSDALDGDLSGVRQCVQISGHFNTAENFEAHAVLLNEASQILVDVFGEAGKHTRAAFGASSLPLNSPVEIQAIFEIW
jgi:NAD(P)H dehydrogenase (quinone)